MIDSAECHSTISYCFTFFLDKSVKFLLSDTNGEFREERDELFDISLIDLDVLFNEEDFGPSEWLILNKEDFGPSEGVC